MHSANHIPFYKKSLRPQLHITPYPQTSVRMPAACRGDRVSAGSLAVSRSSHGHVHTQRFLPDRLVRAREPGGQCPPGEATAFPVRTAAPGARRQSPGAPVHSPLPPHLLAFHCNFIAFLYPTGRHIQRRRREDAQRRCSRPLTATTANILGTASARCRRTPGSSPAPLRPASTRRQVRARPPPAAPLYRAHARRGGRRPR